MAANPVVEYAIPAIFGGVTVVGLLLLRICGGKRLSLSDYFFGLWTLLAMSCHAVFDTYFFYTQRLTRKGENEAVPKPDDYPESYKFAVRKMWRNFAEIDTRFYQDEYQPLALSVTYAFGSAGLILTFLTFIGLLRGGKWAYGLQIATATLHISMTYVFNFPEHLTGYKNVKRLNAFYAINAPFVVIPALAILSGLCKLCCSSAGGVCPVSSTTTHAADHNKKKKQ